MREGRQVAGFEERLKSGLQDGKGSIRSSFQVDKEGQRGGRGAVKDANHLVARTTKVRGAVELRGIVLIIQNGKERVDVERFESTFRPERVTRVSNVEVVL